MSKTRAARRKKKKTGQSDEPMLFTRLNYQILLAGILMVSGGFLAMYLESSQYGIISLYISPVVIVAGFVAVAIAILKNTGTEGEPAAGQTAEGTGKTTSA